MARRWALRPWAALVATRRRGDWRAWEALVREHAGLVYAVVRRCGFDGDEAAELFHDVWLAARDRPGAADGPGDKAAWLASLAAGRARAARRPRTAIDRPGPAS